jgi:hypothetical protein
MFKEELIILHRFLKKKKKKEMKEEGVLSNSSMKTVFPQGIKRKRNYVILLINIRAKIFNKILAN